LATKAIEAAFHNRILKAFAEEAYAIPFGWRSQGVNSRIDGRTENQPAIVVEVVSQKFDSAWSE